MQSKTGQFDAEYLSNLANSSVLPEIKRIGGVGDVTLFGYPYAMRVWLNPDQLAQYRLTVADVSNAIREQNQNYAVGEIGTTPSPRGQVLTFPVQTTGTLVDPSQFADIIVRAAPDGSVVRVRDVARVELGSEDYQISLRLNGQPATGMGIYLRPGGNALATAGQVRAKMQELSSSFPSDVEWRVPYDTTVFVNASIELVMHTFVEAFVLVLIVVYLFLGSFRATIIPMLAIPVSLVGTMAGLLLMGFSINMLTLFGLVLAIGIVVDDAIVVVEAVEKIMHDKGLAAQAAAREAMKGIGGAIVGVTAVICAVFVPVAFLGGVTGTLYKQFAITITISTLLSAVTALTLTPALCALILKQGMHKPKPIQAFDRFFEKVTDRYVAGVAGVIKRALRAAVVYAVIIGGLLFLFKTIPGGFVPEEDKGTMMVAIDLPSGASQERVLEVTKKVEAMIRQEPIVADVISILGFSRLLSLRQPGLHVRDAEGLVGPAGAVAARARADRAHEREARADVGGARVRHQRAADLRPRLDRRLRLSPGCARRRPREAEPDRERGGRRRPGRTSASPVYAAWRLPTCRRCSSTSIATRRSRSACRCRTSTRRSARCSARPSSTSSPRSAPT